MSARRDESGGLFDELFDLALRSPSVGGIIAAVSAVTAAVAWCFGGAGHAIAVPFLFIGLGVGLMAAIGWARQRWSLPAPNRSDGGRRSGPEATPPYRRKANFVTPTERAFYHALRSAVGPDVTVLVQVRLLDLLYLPGRTRGRRAWLSRAAQKHIDFVLCHRSTLQPFLLIELDDPSHDRPDRVDRDVFVDRVLATAGWPLERVRAAAAYDRDALTAVVRRHAAG